MPQPSTDTTYTETLLSGRLNRSILTEWPGSFTRYCGNTGVERIPKYFTCWTMRITVPVNLAARDLNRLSRYCRQSYNTEYNTVQQYCINPFTAPACKISRYCRQTYNTEYNTVQQYCINPFTAPACKISRLKDARSRLLTEYFSVL